MIHIKEGNYYTLQDMALRLGYTRMWILKKARELHIEPLRFGRLFTRYHEEDFEKLKLALDNSKQK